MGKDIFTVQVKKPKNDENRNQKAGPSKWQKTNNGRDRSNGKKFELSDIRNCCVGTGRFFRNIFNAINNFRKKLIWNRIRLSVALLLLILFILQISCVASPTWLTFYDVHTQGLWRVCSQDRDGIECSKYKVLPGYFPTIQALMVVSILVYIIAFIYFVYMIRKTTWPPYLLTICTAIAGIMTLASLSLFTDENLVAVTASKLTFGWAYIVGWLNLVICIATSVVVLFDHKYL